MATSLRYPWPDNLRLTLRLSPFSLEEWISPPTSKTTPSRLSSGPKPRSGSTLNIDHCPGLYRVRRLCRLEDRRREADPTPAARPQPPVSGITLLRGMAGGFKEPPAMLCLDHRNQKVRLTVWSLCHVSRSETARLSPVSSTS